jgi:MFS family permease
MAAEAPTAEAPAAPPSDDPPLAATLPWWALPFSALRHRNYRLYFLGQLVSVVGSWVQTTALMWLAYQMTRQSQWPALIATAQILPTFFLGAWGGALADRVSKRALILGTQASLLVLALLLGVLVLTGHVTPWHLLVISLAAGVVNALDLPARLSFVMDMVGREDVVNAVALNSLLFNAARVVGPAVGGLMLTRLGPGHCFLINGLSFAAVLGALALMDVSGTSPSPPRPGLRALLDGWRHVARRPALAGLLVMTGFMSLFGWPFLTLLPALADQAIPENPRSRPRRWMPSATPPPRPTARATATCSSGPVAGRCWPRSRWPRCRRRGGGGRSSSAPWWPPRPGCAAWRWCATWPRPWLAARSRGSGWCYSMPPVNRWCSSARTTITAAA